MGGVFSGKRPLGCSVGRDWSTYMVKLPKNLIPLSVQSACRRVLFLSRSICQYNKQCVKGGVNRSCCSIQPRETCCTAAIRVASSTRPPKATRTNKIVFHLIPGQKDKIHDSWKGRSYSNPWSSESCGRTVCFPCQGEKWSTCWSPTPSAAENVERKLQHIWVNLDEMATAETKSILKKKLAKDEDNSILKSSKNISWKSHYFKGFCCFSIAIAVNGGQGTHFLISQILKGLTHCALYWILLWPGLWAMNIQNQFADCGKEFSSPLWFNKHNQKYYKKNESNCNICERKFHIAYILKKHIGNVNTIEKCNVFDRGVAKDELARHMKTHHWCLWWYLLWRDLHGKSHFNTNIHVGVLFMKFFYYRVP